MATIPLMADQDVELGPLPNYEDAVSGKPGKAPPDVKSNPRRIPFGAAAFGKEAAAIGSVAYVNIAIRLGFLRKVLGILSFQLITTTAFCVILYLTPNVRGFLQQQSWLVMLSLVGSIVLLFAMYINAHTVPLNYFLLVAWTVTQSVTLGVIVSFYDVEVVIEAVLLTALVIFCLFAYTLQSKRDFQKHWAALFCFTMVFLAASFIQIFVQSPAFNFLMAVVGAGLFSVYLVLDIDRVMHHCSPEEYIEACVSLYLDIINLFIRILQIVNEMNRR